MPWQEVLQAEHRERMLRFNRHHLLPLSGGSCLVVVAPAVYAPEFNTTIRRLGVSKKVFRAHRMTGSHETKVENLVHWTAAYSP